MYGRRLKIVHDQGWAISRAALLYRLRNTADLLVGMNAIQLALRGKQDLAFSPPVTFVNRFYSISNHPVRGAQLSFANNSKILTQTCSRFACKYVSPISSPPERGLQTRRDEKGVKQIRTVHRGRGSNLQNLGGSKFSCKLSVDHRVEANITRMLSQCNKKIDCDAPI